MLRYLSMLAIVTILFVAVTACKPSDKQESTSSSPTTTTDINSGQTETEEPTISTDFTDTTGSSAAGETKHYITQQPNTGQTTRSISPAVHFLSARNVEEKTQALLEYLKSIYGKKILSGQQYSSKGYVETILIYRETGKLPAIMGFDMRGMEEDSDSDQAIIEAINWHRNCNGIVAFTWHWQMPQSYYSGTQKGYSEHTRNATQTWGTDFDIIKAVTPGTEENKLILRHIDNIAGQLRRLEMAGVPVLWRPLHEASGGWFWWGAKGAGPYKMLWKILYDRLEKHHQLTNLIWVWNGQSQDWIVPEDTYDIAGMDIYSGTKQSSHIDVFRSMQKYISKPIALTECGSIPDVDNLIKDGAKWLWWMTWNKDYVYKIVDGKVVANDEYTSAAQLAKNYNADYVITLDELPRFGEDTKRGIPEPVKYFIETGYIEGANPVWVNGRLQLEFELSKMVGCEIRGGSKDYSGFGYIVYRGKHNGESAMFEIDVPEAGTYRAEVRYMGNFGEKYEYLFVNDQQIKMHFPASDSFQISSVDVTLKAGKNTIGFNSNGYGWLSLDSLTLVKK